MRNKRTFLLFVILTLCFNMSSFAQNPVSINCESGNPQTDQAYCWSFTGSSYVNTNVIAGNFSGLTGSLSNPATPSGVISPWIKFNGTGTVSWMMKLDGWAGVASRSFVVLRESATNKGVLDTLYTFAFSQSTATTVQNPQFNVSFSGTYRLYFYFYGSGGTTKGVFDNISIGGTYNTSPSGSCAPIPPLVDADGDGVPDSRDAYPTDPLRAYNVTYVANTLMFEDNWPRMGDFDLNDLVVDYQVKAVLGPSDNVVDMTFNMTLRAIGGFFHNGFMIQLDGLSPSSVASVANSKYTTASWVSLAANGTENGQKYANIVLFDDAYNVMQSAGGNFVNTVPGNPQVAPVKLSATIHFTTGEGQTVGVSSFKINPYLVLSQTRGTEVHLVDNIPSSLADNKVFGTADDNTNPAAGSYYRTKTNLPYAISVAGQSIPYMQELVDFTKGYPMIINWAQSNGTTNSDWYSSTNRNAAYLYSK